MNDELNITDVSGPFREPREPVLSYDYTIQRTTWPMPHAVRIKVAVTEELDQVKRSLLGAVTGSPGQQLMVNKLLSRRISDEKLRIAETEGMLKERRDVLLPPFTGPLAHLFPRLEAWVESERGGLREEIKKITGLSM
ncbi:MAG TPA: hypothetical protein VFQ34_01590 [Nitrospiraceae bacterium]|jgi:hypothetical protein|nr:hypothetical protein [Nitrospiraceae bacterium]